MRALQLCPTVRLVDYKPTRRPCPWESLGKNAGVGCRALLQGIFPTQGSNWHLLCVLCWQVGSSPLAPPGKPRDGSMRRPPSRSRGSGSRVDLQTLTAERGRQARRSGSSAGCHSSPARPRQPWTGWRCGDKNRAGLNEASQRGSNAPSGESSGQCPEPHSYPFSFWHGPVFGEK